MECAGHFITRLNAYQVSRLAEYLIARIHKPERPFNVQAASSFGQFLRVLVSFLRLPAEVRENKCGAQLIQVVDNLDRLRTVMARNYANDIRKLTSRADFF